MRKKLERLWRYYKWYLMAGAGVLLLLLNFWAQKARTPKPDYYVSIVTGNQISESTREDYAARLETVLDDRNGDGKVTVMVNLYRYDGRPGQAENTSAFMAAAVQLAADLREGISLWYLTDGEGLLDADGELTCLGRAEDTVLSGEPEILGFTLLCRAENIEMTSRLRNER